MSDTEVLTVAIIGIGVIYLLTRWVGDLIADPCDEDEDAYQEDEHATAVRPTSPGLPHHRRSITNHEGRIVRPDDRITE